MKKILFVFKDSNLSRIIKDGQINGPADFLFGMNFLDKQKYEVSLINAPRGEFKSFWQKFFYLFEKPFSKITKLGIALEIYHLFKKQIKNAEILFCSTDGIGMAMLFWQRLGLVKAKIIIMAQALPERTKHFRSFLPMRWFISWLLKKAEIILTFTKTAQDDFARDYGLDKNKIKPFPFGADIDFWKIMPEAGSGDFILSIGNDGNRDYKTLVEALPENLKLQIVTKRKVYAKNKLLKIMTGLSDDEVRKLYNQCLFAVIPSIKVKNESPGQSAAMQLMACGKAVILPRIPTMEEFFTDRKNCLFYEPENAADLKEKIELLFNDENLRKKIGANARQIIEEKYNCRRMAERLEKILS